MRVRAHGKVNLYLDVLDRRTDGFTNIETIFQTVSLWDTLHIENKSRGLSLTSSDPSLETDDSNLVLRAATSLRTRTGCDKGAHMHLEKAIPIAGGMAGGSVDAAATLVALNELWGLDLDHDALAACALELGSDVPYCLTGGTAAATGRGEIIEQLPSLPETWFVLARPDFGIAAGDVYNNAALTRNRQAQVNGRTPAFERALKSLHEGDIAGLMFNRMETAIDAMHPELVNVRGQLMGAGCKAAIVSGSGPTLTGLCENEADAKRIAGEINGVETHAVHSVSNALVFD